MPLIELELPAVAYAALLGAAAAASIPPSELLADALRSLPAFQRALAARPEGLPAFTPPLERTNAPSIPIGSTDPAEA